MLTFIFIIGFVILAIFIPQAISGLNWQELIKILQEVDDQWIKEIAQSINVEYTTMTQFATQTILICAGILIAYIVVATIIVKLIKKLSNSNQKEKTTYNQNIEYNKNTEYNQKIELTKDEKIKYNLPIIILATTTIIMFIILIVFSDKNNIVMTIFGVSFWLQLIIIPFLIHRKNLYLKYYRKSDTTKNNKAKQKTIKNTSKKIDNASENKTDEKAENTNENTKLNEQTDKSKIIRPQINIEKIRELQKQLKEQNKGEITNE